MCNLIQGFQLCTCGKSELNADWKLVANNNKQQSIYGSTIDMENIDILPDEEFLLDKLNNLDCFDFAYKPSHNDKIEWMHNNQTKYVFTYKFDEWVKQNESTTIFGFAVAC